MVQLTPMTNDVFEAFMEISMQDHIQSQIEAGFWQPEEEATNMQNLRAQILPQGRATPNHSFFSVQTTQDELVGGLWYMVVEEDGQHLIFVVDIQIYEPFRRRGYATQAFRLMEDQARAMSITTIALNVFEHNHSARSMYEKLGYVKTGDSMMKVLA